MLHATIYRILFGQLSIRVGCVTHNLDSPIVIYTLSFDDIITKPSYFNHSWHSWISGMTEEYHILYINKQWVYYLVVLLLILRVYTKNTKYNMFKQNTKTVWLIAPYILLKKFVFARIALILLSTGKPILLLVSLFMMLYDMSIMFASAFVPIWKCLSGTICNSCNSLVISLVTIVSL